MYPYTYTVYAMIQICNIFCNISSYFLKRFISETARMGGRGKGTARSRLPTSTKRNVAWSQDPKTMTELNRLSHPGVPSTLFLSIVPSPEGVEMALVLDVAGVKHWRFLSTCMNVEWPSDQDPFRHLHRDYPLAGNNPSGTFPKPPIPQVWAGTRSHPFDPLSCGMLASHQLPWADFQTFRNFASRLLYQQVAGNQSEWDYLHHGNQAT